MTVTGRIIGTGSYVPERIVTNEDLAKLVETSDEWIVTRTGIHERRIAVEEGTSAMASRAAERALENAGIKAEELDIILMATSSPDHCFPNGACEVQAAIGAVNAVAYDISAACSGFEFALSTVQAFIRAGIYKTALIIGADRLVRPGHLRSVWRRCRSSSDSCRENRRNSQCYGIRRRKRTCAFLCSQKRGEFPERKEAGAGIHIYGRPGGFQICSKEGSGMYPSGAGGE